MTRVQHVLRRLKVLVAQHPQAADLNRLLRRNHHRLLAFIGQQLPWNTPTRISPSERGPRPVQAPCHSLVKVYLGQTRSKSLLLQLGELGWGEVTQRGELPPRRQPWFYDCGSFKDWQAKEPFDGARYQRDLWTIADYVEGRTRYDYKSGTRAPAAPVPPPQFVVLPDLPAKGPASLALSLTYLRDYAALFDRAPPPAVLVVQDGMHTADIAPWLPQLGGLFVGGTVDWKRATMGTWIDLAHAHGRFCHVGRGGSLQTLERAISLGADSVDTSLPLWSQDNLERFIRAVCVA